MKDKGISPVIASIILVLIVLSLAGAYTVFTGRLSSSQTEAGQKSSQELVETATTLFRIDGVQDQNVVLRNTGQNDIAQGSLTVLVDGTILNYTLASPIAPGSSGNLNVQGLWKFEKGDRLLEIAGGAFSDSVVVEIEHVRESLVGEWLFEEGSGASTKDSVSGATGTLTGSSLWNSDTPLPASEYSLKIGEVAGDYAELPHSSSLSPTSAITIEGRAKVLAGGDGFVEKWNVYGIRLRAASAYGYVSIGGAPTACELTATAALASTGWHHVLYSYDGTTARMYLDGNPVGSKSCSGNIDTSTNVLRIGKNQGGGTYDGFADNVRIYNRALTPDVLYAMKAA
ncbi:MAG: hypothetical protein HYS81_04505 [Candidatus Aenigmatarchaeota archaeon]|nr:MAG: hypothetical protein HYS81_04505 [Candidatus Aenigmarchaeota archaeon]